MIFLNLKILSNKNLKKKTNSEIQIMNDETNNKNMNRSNETRKFLTNTLFSTEITRNLEELMCFNVVKSRPANAASRFI